jgi:hypothetical protein
MTDTVAPAPAADASVDVSTSATPAVAETPTDASAPDTELELAPAEVEYEIEVPEEVVSLRESPERLLFSAQVEHAEAVKDADFASLPLEVQAMVTAEAREVLADLGLNRNEGLELRSAINNHDPAIPTAQAWDTMCELMNREFGVNSKEAFDRARALVQRDERVAQLLDIQGRGNNPKIVLQIARAAMRNRGR